MTEQKSNVAKAKQQLYLRVFGNPAGKEVIQDLSKLCFGASTTASLNPNTGNIDPYAMAILEGRRQVLIEILKMLNLDFDAFYEQYESENVLNEILNSEEQ